MHLSKKEFDILTLSDAEGVGRITTPEQKEIAKALTEAGLLCEDGVTPAGYQALEPYRVKRAIFFAAGFGSRMVPVTYEMPKPLVSVNGVRIIETLLDAVVQSEIRDIIIVRGYRGEKFDILLKKYPFIRFIDNTDYDKANNILSAYLVRDLIQNTYVFESDLYLNSPKLLGKYQYESNYLGVPTEETEDWCFTADENLRITSLKRGGKNCYHMFGISYISADVGERLATDLQLAFRNEPDAKTRFWDDVALDYYKDRYDIKVRPCTFDDVSEIDTLDELIEIDSRYRIYKDWKEPND